MDTTMPDGILHGQKALLYSDLAMLRSLQSLLGSVGSPQSLLGSLQSLGCCAQVSLCHGSQPKREVCKSPMCSFFTPAFLSCILVL